MSTFKLNHGMPHNTAVAIAMSQDRHVLMHVSDQQDGARWVDVKMSPGECDAIVALLIDAAAQARGKIRPRYGTCSICQFSWPAEKIGSFCGKEPPLGDTISKYPCDGVVEAAR